MMDSFQNLKLSTPQAEPAHGAVLALGNFDGVHRGHHAVIKAALDHATRLEVPMRVLTLEPHPKTLFNPSTEPFRVTPFDAKVRILKAMGVDEVVVVDFTPELSKLSGSDFVEQILLRQHGARHIVAGYDFVFGYQRSGNMQRLRNWVMMRGVGVTEVMPCRDSYGEVMSSSRIRDALRQGDLPTAQHILGRPWSVSGVVISGDQRGRLLGTPTANIDMADYVRPKFGVYSAFAKKVGTAQTFPAIAYVGKRPTVQGEREMLEFHIFDFYDTIYGQEWELEFIEFLRPEHSFPDLASLQAQIIHDTEAAKASLSCIHL